MEQAPEFLLMPQFARSVHHRQRVHSHKVLGKGIRAFLVSFAFAAGKWSAGLELPRETPFGGHLGGTMRTSDHEPKIREKKFMRKYLIGAVLVGAVATPAFALTEGPYFVGLNTTTHTCSVVTKMEAGMKMMGKYKTKAAAEKAMAGMKECKG